MFYIRILNKGIIIDFLYILYFLESYIICVLGLGLRFIDGFFIDFELLIYLFESFFKNRDDNFVSRGIYID